MSKKVFYDGSWEGLSQALETAKAGAKIFCRTCGSELIVVTDTEMSTQLKKHPGIYCPKDSQHIAVLFELKDMRKSMRNLLNREE